MKTLSKSLPLNSMLTEAANLYSGGLGDEDVISFLREHGLKKAESVKGLMLIKNIPLSEADRLIHLSQTWQDAFSIDESVREAMDQALMELGFEHVDDESRS